MSILNYQTVVVNATPTPAQLYRLGWNAYLSGLSYATLATADERRGWMSANKAEAACNTPAYDESMVW